MKRRDALRQCKAIARSKQDPCTAIVQGRAASTAIVQAAKKPMNGGCAASTAIVQAAKIIRGPHPDPQPLLPRSHMDLDIRLPFCSSLRGSGVH